MWTETGSSLSGTWNTILYLAFAQLPVFSCFRNMENSPLSRFWPLSSILLLPGTWNTIHYSDFVQLPVYSCFREHETRYVIQTFINFASLLLLHSPLSRLCSIVSLLLFLGKWNTILYPYLADFQSILASGNMEHNPLYRLCSIASLLLFPGKWNTILYQDSVQLPGNIAPGNMEHNALSNLWSIVSLLFLPRTWNYPYLAESPDSCFREHGTQTLSASYPYFCSEA